MLGLVLEELGPACAAGVRSSKQGTRIDTCIVWRPFICSGFPVEGLHFPL